ncbi:MAG TPA: hypothetical protein PKK23_15420 [Nitrospirales bacterium]|nr:hypothetical protein [Nitrospirales bacterium]
MREQLIIALDGHDGAGKTTLAAALATRLGGIDVRPFSGSIGAELLRAGENRDVVKLVMIGSTAIENAVSSVPGNIPVVLDRGWMTVASFVPESAEFFSQWNTWIPTVLCWAELSITQARLAIRGDENSEPLEWHEHYLAVYLDLAKRSGSLILRTDLMDHESCIKQLVSWVMEGRVVSNSNVDGISLGSRKPSM